MFGDATVQQLVSIMLMQKDRILKDQRIVKGAKGSESYKDYLTEDTFPALAGLETALKTFTGTITSPGMERAAAMLDMLSTGIGHLSGAYGKFAADNPKLAEAIGDAATATVIGVGGKLSYNLGSGILKTLTGGGATAALAGSATALDGSALALDKSALSIEAAAGRLGMGGALGAVEGAGAGGAGLAGITLGGLAASVAGVAAPIALAIAAGKYDQQKREDTAKTFNTPQAKALPNLDDQTFLQRLWGTVPGHATGGLVTGPGGPREDRVLRRLSPGEYVINAAATARYRALLEAINGGDITIPGLANGGAADLSRGGLARVSMFTDSSEAVRQHDIMARAVYDALRRIRGEGGLDGDSGGGGGGGGGGEAPSLRHGREGSSAGLPSLRYGHASGGGYRDAPTHPGHGAYRDGPHVTTLDRDGMPTKLGHTGSKFAGKAPAIMRGLMDRYGLTQEQAAGIVGNLGHESAGFTAYQEKNPRSGRGGAGWAQWTGPRRRQFEAWVAQHPGMDPRSDEASWRFLTEADPEMARAVAAVKRTNNRHDAVRTFHDHFERSADIDRHGRIVAPRNWNSRLNYADKAFAMGPGPSQPGVEVAGNKPADRYPDESRRAGIHPELMIRPPVERHAAGVDFDHSGLDAAIAKVDTLHAKLKALKATASVDIHHTHRDERVAGNAPRFSPFRSHAGAPAGRTTV